LGRPPGTGAPSPLHAVDLMTRHPRAVGPQALSSSAPIVRLAATDRYNRPSRRRYTRRLARLFGTGAKGVGLAVPKWIFVRRWL